MNVWMFPCFDCLSVWVFDCLSVCLSTLKYKFNVNAAVSLDKNKLLTWATTIATVATINIYTHKHTHTLSTHFTRVKISCCIWLFTHYNHNKRWTLHFSFFWQIIWQLYAKKEHLFPFICLSSPWLLLRSFPHTMCVWKFMRVALVFRLCCWSCSQVPVAVWLTIYDMQLVCVSVECVVCVRVVCVSVVCECCACGCVTLHCHL